MIPTLYKKLLTLYPRAFKERLGKSMEQTFNDLYKERKHQSGQGFFLPAIFTETAIGIVHEHLYLRMEGDGMKNIVRNPASAAIGSAILLLITFTWGGLIVEEIYCLRGIRCD